MVNIVLNKLNVNKEDCLFVGDSDVDIITGKSNNMTTIAVTWGYKDIDVIRSNNPDYIIDKPQQLINILKEINNYD